MIPPIWALTPLKWIYDAIRKRKEKRNLITSEFHETRQSLKTCLSTYQIDWHLAQFSRLLDRNPVLFDRPGMAVFYERWIQPRKDAILLVGAGPDPQSGTGIDFMYWTHSLALAMKRDLDRIEI